MIVWQGFGFLAALIPVGLLILSTILGIDKNIKFSDEIILLLSAVIVWLLGRKLNTKPAKILIDPKTNQEVIMKSKHAMFWIPMEYYAVLWIIAALSVLMKNI